VFAAQNGSFSTGDEPGFSAEVPYGPADKARTSIVQVFTDQSHPELGNGALWIQRFPEQFKSAQAVDIMNQLNLLDAGGDAMCWVLGQHRMTISTTSFLPSMIARPKLFEYLLIHSTIRANWLHHPALRRGDRDGRTASRPGHISSATSAG
jgi:hypothetical protein